MILFVLVVSYALVFLLGFKIGHDGLQETLEDFKAKYRVVFDRKSRRKK